LRKPAAHRGSFFIQVHRIASGSFLVVSRFFLRASMRLKPPCFLDRPTFELSRARGARWQSSSNENAPSSGRALLKIAGPVSALAVAAGWPLLGVRSRTVANTEQRERQSRTLFFAEAGGASRFFLHSVHRIASGFFFSARSIPPGCSINSTSSFSTGQRLRSDTAGRSPVVVCAVWLALLLHSGDLGFCESNFRWRSFFLQATQRLG
jgi:hypothetical protein